MLWETDFVCLTSLVAAAPEQQDYFIMEVVTTRRGERRRASWAGASKKKLRKIDSSIPNHCWFDMAEPNFPIAIVSIALHCIAQTLPLRKIWPSPYQSKMMRCFPSFQTCVSQPQKHSGLSDLAWKAANHLGEEHGWRFGRVHPTAALSFTGEQNVPNPGNT